MENTHQLVDHLFRNQSGKLTAILIKRFGYERSTLIDDIIQDTFLTAMKTWPLKGTPDNPEAWLTRVSYNKVLNEIKRVGKYAESEMEDRSDSIDVEYFTDKEISDSQLRLLFAFCTDELPVKTQIIITLKTLGGLSVAEIASAFMMNQEAVKKSISRARSGIQAADIQVPLAGKAFSKLDAANLVLYLMFNEGYRASEGEQLIKEHLCLEAVRLARLIQDHEILMNPNTSALLALMYFNIARFDSRMDSDMQMIDLKGQDRSKWDHNLIAQGFDFLRQSRSGDEISRYHLEAGIASVHCSSNSFEETNWETISKYYSLLYEKNEDLGAYLNYLIALSYVDSPHRSLNELEKNKDTFAGIAYRYHATMADLYFRSEDYGTAALYYEIALKECLNSFEKKYLDRKLRESQNKNLKPN